MTALETMALERRRVTKASNERARNHATAMTQMSLAILVAGLVVPAFDPKVDIQPQQAFLAFLFAGLIYALAHIILGTVEPEE